MPAPHQKCALNLLTIDCVCGRRGLGQSLQGHRGFLQRRLEEIGFRVLAGQVISALFQHAHVRIQCPASFGACSRPNAGKYVGVLAGLPKRLSSSAALGTDQVIAAHFQATFFLVAAYPATGRPWRQRKSGPSMMTLS